MIKIRSHSFIFQCSFHIIHEFPNIHIYACKCTQNIKCVYGKKCQIRVILLLLLPPPPPHTHYSLQTMWVVFLSVKFVKLLFKNPTYSPNSEFPVISFSLLLCLLCRITAVSFFSLALKMFSLYHVFFWIDQEFLQVLCEVFPAEPLCGLSVFVQGWIEDGPPVVVSRYDADSGKAVHSLNISVL